MDVIGKIPSFFGCFWRFYEEKHGEATRPVLKKSLPSFLRTPNWGLVEKCLSQDLFVALIHFWHLKKMKRTWGSDDLGLFLCLPPMFFWGLTKTVEHPSDCVIRAGEAFQKWLTLAFLLKCVDLMQCYVILHSNICLVMAIKTLVP